MSSHEFLLLQLANFVVPATILAILALALNVQWGMTGLFNAGVAAFVGVGAYTFGMLTTGVFANPDLNWFHWGPERPWDLIIAGLVAMALSGMVGGLVAIPTLRLRADYLAIATLALAEIVRLVLKNERSFSGGDQTLAFIPRPFDGIVPRGPYSDGVFMLVVILLLVIVFLLASHLTRTPWGRALKAVREDEEAAQALGKDPLRLKLAAFVLGCAGMGLVGALTASHQGVAIPDQFAPFTTFVVYVVVILGGSGNPKGVVLGAYLYYVFGWTTQQLKAAVPPDLALRMDFINQIVIGLLLVLVILWRPAGIIPEERFVPNRRRLKLLPSRLRDRIYPPQWFGLAFLWFAVSLAVGAAGVVHLHGVSTGRPPVGPVASWAVGILVASATISALAAFAFARVLPWARLIGIVASLGEAIVTITLVFPIEGTFRQVLLLRLILDGALLYVFTRPGARTAMPGFVRKRSTDSGD